MLFRSNDTATTEIYTGEDTLSLHDALPISGAEDHHLVFDGAQSKETMAGLGWHALAGADVDVHVEDVIASDDRVAVRGRVTGTHRESLMDLAPTRRSFEIDYVWFCHVKDDRIAEIWSLPDGLGLLKQLDAVPETFPIRPLSGSTQRQQR